MKVVARRREGFVHDVEIEDGAHTLVVDEPAVAGGSDAGPAPTRLLAAGLASCIAITMEMYAQRKEWDIGAVEVEVNVDYEKFAPSSFAATNLQPRGQSSGESLEPPGGRLHSGWGLRFFASVGGTCGPSSPCTPM